MSRTQKDFAPRKEKLIQIALDQFLEKGYENTTITDLQKAFGLTKCTITSTARKKYWML